jgi:3-isopropylmalate/(R)-2-methylmalate dehydratase large subunit
METAPMVTSQAPDASPRGGRAGAGASLFDKLWRTHVVDTLSETVDLLAIDLHLLHDLNGPAGLRAIRDRGLTVRAPGQTFATPDHGVSTEAGRTDASSESSRRFLPALRSLCQAFGVPLFDLNSGDQGIVHVIGPELGLTLPGLTVVCGDSHTCTHGAFGALAWGIGMTEVMQVLATQMLIQERPKSMRITIDGRLGDGVTAKDLILYIIGRHGAAGGVGHAVEFAGEAVRALSMDGRMSLCNLAVEFGARFGLVAPDETTYAYLKGRPYAPTGALWDLAMESWRALPSEAGSLFDREIVIDAAGVAPQVTWGVTLDDVAALGDVVPGPDPGASEAEQAARLATLDYMGLEPGAPLAGIPIQHVFIGSCANSRLSDLQAAAAVVEGRRVAPGVRAMVVPGSQGVKRAAERLGLDKIFTNAGFQWREPGCSMCVAMNGDIVPAGERCVSTSNRNFVGRQGPGARTHLASPVTAAASAILGRIGGAGSIP